MRVLWFTNILLPGHTDGPPESVCGSGGWMVTLLEELRKCQGWQIAVAAVGPLGEEVRRRVQGVDFFVIPCRKSEGVFARRRALRRCADIAREWRPDLVHVHGTERFYGLLSARGMIDTPTVISIQGLLGPYSRWYHYFGNRTLTDIIRMHRWAEPLVLRGPLWGLWKYKHAARVEREIIRGTSHFIGRTFWDRTHVMAMNPQATYHHVGELLRQPFWDSRWSLDKCQRHRVLFTNAGHPRKGLEVLLDVIPLLKPKYPDIEVRVAGNISYRSGYGRYIRRRLRSLGGSAMELGALNAEQMAAELLESHVFVSPSFIDNSPNAVCEAQMVGMPVIATYTGGVPSLIEEGRTGLFFPAGDALMLAARLEEIFEDDELAVRLATQACVAARRRHNPETVIHEVLGAYERVLAGVGNKNAVAARFSL